MHRPLKEVQQTFPRDVFSLGIYRAQIWWVWTWENKVRSHDPRFISYAQEGNIKILPVDAPTYSRIYQDTLTQTLSYMRDHFELSKKKFISETCGESEAREKAA